MIGRALERIASGDDALVATAWRTLRLALESTAIALAVGVPLGTWLGMGTGRGRRVGRVLANAGLGLPPVVLGVYLALLLLPGSSLGALNWTNTLEGIVLAQVLLAVPIVIALTTAAVAQVPASLTDQARAFGASALRRGVLAVREARVGVIAAVIAALGSAVAEVGAIVIVGGEHPRPDQHARLDRAARPGGGRSGRRDGERDRAARHAGGARGRAHRRPAAGARVITRRAFLARGAAAAAAGPLLLAGCGGDDAGELGPQAKALAGRSIALDYASYYAPAELIRGLAQARAAKRGAALTLSADPSGADAQLATLRRWTAKTGGFGVIVVAAFDAAQVEPVAAKALDAGIRIVPFVTPLEHKTAAITYDFAAAGRMLAGHAAARAGDGARAIVVAPPVGRVPDPFAAPAQAGAEALSAAFPDAHVVKAQAEADAADAVGGALRAEPGARVVLCWSDGAALGALHALQRRGISGAYVGALGAPALATPRALDRLRAGGPLQALVAARPTDLAHALVDLPFALLKGGAAHDVAVAPVLLERGAGNELRTFRAAYRLSSAS